MISVDWQTLVALGLVLLSGVWMVWSFTRPFLHRQTKGGGDGHHAEKDELLQITSVDEKRDGGKV